MASYTVDDPTGHDESFQLLTVPGKQAGLYGVSADRLAAYFLFAQPSSLGHLGLEERKEKLAEAFDGIGWYVPRLIERMERADDFYFDAVSQVRMSSWSRGRVCLVGDACQCVSLISGQGSALAMAGAYVLAGELAREDGRHVEAFRRYEDRMAPEIASKQEKARRFARSFVPSSHLGIFLRDTFVELMSMPFVARYFVRSFLADELALEDYARTRGDAPASSHPAPVA